MAEAAKAFGSETPLIVRSSCTREDTADTSNAGAFLSVADVRGDRALAEAVEAVIASYDPPAPADFVLLQPYLQRVTLAGVALTRDASTGGHYVIVNYEESGGTDGVTSGRASGLKTHISSKDAPVTFPSPVREILELCAELETLLAHDSLDIEFAIDDADQLYLFQVRPLILPRGSRTSAEAQKQLLHDIERTIAKGMCRHPYLHGNRTIYGVMPDWNPAEIIGVRPRPLALSLYRDLVTDSVWAYQRNNYGYKNLRSFPLMVHFSGLPYIDVRVSLNSFIPSDTDEKLADRLANYYLDRLLAVPSLHDKVEFEIVFSCYTIDLPDRLETLKLFGFQDEELQTLMGSLRRLTNNIISTDGLWRIDRDKLAILAERHALIMNAEMDDVQRIYWLIEDCKRYGTLPFAGLARAAFIAMQMMRSLVSVGVFSEVEYDAFLGSLNTVSSQITKDFFEEDREAFLKKYGHLRPGTYDILSPRYDETPDVYFDWSKSRNEAAKHAGFSPSSSQMAAINQLLVAHGLDCDAAGMLDFIKSAIEWREQSKYLFTRSLSDVLTCFRRFGTSLGFGVEDLSYASIGVIAQLNSSSSRAAEALAESIEAGRRLHEQTLLVQLPSLISAPEDAWGFFWPQSEPNFVTKGSVTARSIMHTDKSSLTGAIVLIESADPGFDWIFSHSIAGLITAYGGVNSHMAIRASELGLPAVIGAGELLFKQWSAANMLHIDCANRRVDVLQ